MAGPVDEREAFENVMASHVAKLMDFARPYVGRLCRADSEYFVERALEEAWTRRDNFEPTKASLLMWWEGCLKAAALTRKAWCVQYSHKVEWVPGSKLGRH